MSMEALTLAFDGASPKADRLANAANNKTENDREVLVLFGRNKQYR